MRKLALVGSVALLYAGIAWAQEATSPAKQAPVAAADDFVSIFNGKDLAGWDGDPKHWSVKDDAITGVINKPIRINSFIIWKDGDKDGELENFELRLKVRITGNNSGLNYRSKRFPKNGPYGVGGYQADIDVKSDYTGLLYEENGRQILAMRGQKVIIDPCGGKWIVGSLGDPKEILGNVDYSRWNDYGVIAKGNHLVHIFNGTTVLDVIDHQADKRALKGILAFQVHVGPPMEVQFKDIQIKRLPPGGILTPEEAPIPPGSPKLKTIFDK